MPALKPILHCHGVWTRLTTLAKQHANASVAVPYFGSGASELLPLRKGSTLVIRFDEVSVRCGQVNPVEVLALIRRGVEVHACANLHAKVFVFGSTAIVGSANVSTSSEKSLIEACAELKSRDFAERCKSFVHSLMGDRVGLEFAKSMVPLYRPPRTGGVPRSRGKATGRAFPQHSDMWLVPLVSMDWKDIDLEQEAAGWEDAERALADEERSHIDTFCWWGGKLLHEIKRGQRVLMNTKFEDGRIFVSPPGRVLNVRRYRVNNKAKAIVYVELPNNRRRRNMTTFIKSLGPVSEALGNARRTKRLRDSELVYALGKVFA